MTNGWHPTTVQEFVDRGEVELRLPLVLVAGGPDGALCPFEGEAKRVNTSYCLHCKNAIM